MQSQTPTVIRHANHGDRALFVIDTLGEFRVQTYEVNNSGRLFLIDSQVWKDCEKAISAFNNLSLMFRRSPIDS